MHLYSKNFGRYKVEASTSYKYFFSSNINYIMYALKEWIYEVDVVAPHNIFRIEKHNAFLDE